MTVTEVAGVAGAPPARRGQVRRLADRARTTPGRLSVIVVVLVLLGLASGLVGWAALRQRADLVHDMTVRSSPLGASALDIYRSLSEADAAAATAFLTGGAEPAELRNRYQASIAQAANAVVVASGNAVGSGAATAELALLSTALPVYTGLVETARAINRQGFPLGAAYLREASGLMRDTLLPAAQRLYESEKRRLAAAQDRAAAVPWACLGLAGATLIALVAAQLYLSRRTKRLVNIGLALATVAALGLVAWVGVATIAMGNHLDAGRRYGSAQTQLLAEARIVALQARTDEALTLIARGSGQGFEKTFQEKTRHLDELLARASADAPDGAGRAASEGMRQSLQAWQDTHKQLRDDDDKGDYPAAVKRATGAGEDDVPAVFARLDTALNDGIGQRDDRFARETTAAEGNLAGSDAAVVVLTLLLICGTVAGARPRIAEYR
ncbi:MAG TPA: hypothetical protein VFB84_21810 [Micromonosporaceae bacterium]|nr:hypothetical protein [Micromonosporaceae bacterium]